MAAFAVLGVLLLDPRAAGRDGDHQALLSLNEALQFGLFELLAIRKDGASGEIVHREFSGQDCRNGFLDLIMHCAGERNAEFAVLKKW